MPMKNTTLHTRIHRYASWEQACSTQHHTRKLTDVDVDKENNAIARLASILDATHNTKTIPKSDEFSCSRLGISDWLKEESDTTAAKTMLSLTA